jgi:hypothetical protein
MARKPVHRDPLTEHVAEDDGKGVERRRRATLANVRDVRIDFWVSSRQAPLILVIVISGLLGALIGALVMRRKGKDKDKDRE